MEVRIYYEDTDCGGVVYYANYLKYFERARTSYLEDRGLSVAGLMDEGTVFVVAHVVTEKVSRRVVVEGSARLAVTDGNGKVKRPDKTIVAALQSPPQPS